MTRGVGASAPSTTSVGTSSPKPFPSASQFANLLPRAASANSLASLLAAQVAKYSSGGASRSSPTLEGMAFDESTTDEAMQLDGILDMLENWEQFERPLSGSGSLSSGDWTGLLAPTSGGGSGNACGVRFCGGFIRVPSPEPLAHAS